MMCGREPHGVEEGEIFTLKPRHCLNFPTAHSSSNSIRTRDTHTIHGRRASVKVCCAVRYCKNFHQTACYATTAHVCPPPVPAGLYQEGLVTGCRWAPAVEQLCPRLQALFDVELIPRPTDENTLATTAHRSGSVVS